MAGNDEKPVNALAIQVLLKQKKRSMKLRLDACAGCTLCAESCFLFMSKGKDPRYMPSYKVLNTLGVLYRKKGKVSRAELEKMKELLWKNCMLCERCYCPIGVDLPNMIAFARRILRSQGISGVYPHSIGAPEDEQCEAVDEDSEKETVPE
jgi:Fe-S oxidoreductase